MYIDVYFYVRSANRDSANSYPIWNVRNAFAVSFASITMLRYVIIVLHSVMLVIELSVIAVNKMLFVDIFIGLLLYYRVNEVHSMNRRVVS